MKKKKSYSGSSVGAGLLDSDLEQFIRGMPKTELHMHIEGSFEPELAFAIAERNDILPGSPAFPYKTVGDLKTAYSFSDLKSFLNVYYKVSQVLLKKEDFYDLARAYCEKAMIENIRHTEIFFDPQSHTSRGIPFNVVADAINEALADARKKGLSNKLIVSILRDSPVGTPEDPADFKDGFGSMEEATGWATIKQAVQYNASVERPEYKIIGIGLDSNEMGYPPSLFTEIYGYARQNGLFCTAHAGEEGPPEYIWEVLEELNCVRIDHGVRSTDDPGLVAYMGTKRDTEQVLQAYDMPHKIPATVCPMSNYELKVFSKPGLTNILKMLDMGMQVSVNSDDPAYFGGYVTENYLELLKWLAPGRGEGRSNNLVDIYRLCVNGFEASWILPAEKIQFIDEAAAYFLSNPGLLYRTLSD